MRIFVFAVLLFSSLQAMQRAAPARSEHIGVRTFQFQDASRNRPVAVEFWYPTAQVGQLDVAQDPVWVHPKEMREALMAQGKFPLILMSHGHGGDRRDRSWLVAPLVEAGFVVASVEHFGNSWRNYNPHITLRFWERAKDVSFALTSLLKDEKLAKSLDANRIGFVGYSMGGMTGLALGGARAENVKEIMVQQNVHLKTVEPEVLEASDFSEAEVSFADSRIKALALLSPAAFVYPPKSLKQIRVPVALVATVGDEILPFKDHAFKVMSSLTSSKLKMLSEQSSHYVFLNRVSDMGKQSLREEIRTDAIESDRAVVHLEVSEFLIDFFRQSL